MIKGVTLVQEVSAEGAFSRLGELFSALGFEAGKGWRDEQGTGAAFLAPLGNLELVNGRVPTGPRVLVEVRDLDTVHDAVRAWMLAELRSGSGSRRIRCMASRSRSREIFPRRGGALRLWLRGGMR